MLGVAIPLIVGFAQPTFAQEEEMIEEVVTTGTRSRARSVEDSPAPVDILSADYFTDQGDTDFVNLLRNIVPSYNVNAQPISDAATIVRPANLRGLAPDHTLVLINGKRRHRIPSIALKRVEVLRDGAAAQ
jgi:iron complex outermembrane receptor protein